MVSPWPPVRSGVADYASEQADALSPLALLTRYSPGDAARAACSSHDILLVHVGNDPLHWPSVEMLSRPGRKTPAVLVLHDFSLHHLFAAALLDRGREREYVQELERAHGERGRLLGARVLSGERVPVWDTDPWGWPMSGAVARDADAVVTHSRLVRGAVLLEAPGRPVLEVPHHVVPAARTPKDEARRLLGLPQDRLVAVTLGIVTPAKRVGRILEAIALLSPRERPFLFVGGDVGGDDPLRGEVRRLGLEEDVRFSGYLSGEAFWIAASAADVAVNLRFPTMGETSGAVCRLSGFGLPVVVSDVGWFRELPASFADKVPVGAGETEAVAASLARLADSGERRRREDAARAWGEARRPAAVAAAVLEILSAVVRGEARTAALGATVATRLFSLGVGFRGGTGAERGPDALVVVALANAASGLLPASLQEEAPGRADSRSSNSSTPT